ncbi:hypothetical protein GCM10009745_76500 [Kribbella yunnanensis]|uniref:Luciferase-like domain-containing protein n=1 Tax=Kribbella yunnanensis TaxID=190194 RepID=A0ABP4V2J0_9ACTN
MEEEQVDVVLGVSTTAVAEVRAAAVAADRAGLDLIGIQDEPYFGHLVDAFALIADLLTRTERIQVFPDVVPLPLRPAAGLARTASSLSLLSGGRFQLGLGAGGVWDAMTSMGVERLAPAQSLAALEEAIALLRQLWRADAEVTADGDWYAVASTSTMPATESGQRRANASATNPPIECPTRTQGRGTFTTSSSFNNCAAPHTTGRSSETTSTGSAPEAPHPARS